MSQNENSLLVRIRGDASGGKAAIAETRAAVAQLRQSFGPELTQTVSLANKAFSGISDNLNIFVGQRIPLVGGAFVRVTENLRNFTSEGSKTEKTLAGIAKSVQSVATQSNRTVPEITNFLTKFAQLGTQAERDKSAIEFFGASLGAKLIPELEETGTAMASVAEESAAAGGAIAGLAGPVGIAVVAIAALAAGAVVASKEIFGLAQSAAEFQGKLFDLSQQTGVSVETLSALEVVARTTGSSIESLTQSLGIFQKNLEEASESADSKAGKAFKKLGVDATDTEQALRQTVAALARMPEGFRQTSLALEVFGRGGKAFLAIAKESKGDIDEITKRLKGLGIVTTDQARLADEFNDQLILLEVQLRGLGTKAIPVVLDVLKDLSKTLEDNRVLFNILQGIVQSFAISLKLGFGTIKSLLDPVIQALQVTAGIIHKIREDVEFIVGHPLPGFSAATPTPQPAPQPTITPEDAAAKDFKKKLEEEIAARQRLQGVLNFDFQQRRDLAEANIALAQREFEAGKITREQLLQATLVNNRKKTQADIDQLQVERDIKLREEALAKDDLDKKTQISNAILAIDAQITSKRADLQKTQKDLTAKSQLEERKDQLAHEQAQLELLTKFNEQRVATIESGIRAGVIARQKGLDEIEEIENKGLVLRGQILKRELELAGVGPDRQAVVDKIAALENDRTELERAQSQRRISIAQEEAAAKAAILQAEADTLIRIGEITDQSRIASLRAQAGLRIRTEEETEKTILKIRLDAIDRQDEAARISRAAAEEQIEAGLRAIFDKRRTLTAPERIQALAAIPDDTKRAEEQKRNSEAIQQNIDEEIAAQAQANKDRDRLDKELNDQLRINNAERRAIQQDGNRDIDEGRRKDLDNAQRYADGLEEIETRIKDTERDTKDEVIRLMQLHFAKRKDIIRAQRDLDLADEEARHQRVTRSIKRQQAEVDEQIRILESHLKALKIGTTEEIEQYERLIEELEKLRVKRQALKGQQDAEGERSKTTKEAITVEADLKIASPDAALQDVFDGLGESLTNVASKFADLIGAGEEFAAISGQLAKQIGGTLAGAFDQFAQALGQTVANWVLLGETGPAVMRKILAQALASLAAEATVQAIKELALGFATLFFNPAQSAAHFTAAALWGSIAGVSAVAGRKVAGDLFKPKSGDSGGSGSSSTNNGQLNPLTLNRNQPQPNITIIMHGEAGEAFKYKVKKVIRDDYDTAGDLREMYANDGRY